MEHADFHTPTWRRLEDHIKARIAEMHQALEADLSDTATARARGRISELKHLLALAEPARAEGADPERRSQAQPLWLQPPGTT